MEFDEGFIDFLTKHRLLITQQLQMDRRFLFDYLISKSSFDKTDIELIQAEKTTESKAGKFLDILTTKGESAFHHFIDALQILNPNLYETLTGESATKGSNPIFSDIQRHITSGVGSIYLDVDILSSYSKRLSEDLQELTLWYDQKIKENNELRRKLEEALSEKKRLQRRITALEKHVSDTEEALVNEAHSSVCKVNESLLQRFEGVRYKERTNQFIIQLQMKLLTAHEESETLRQQMEELKASNDDLMRQLSKVNVDYAFKKKETTRLSQQLKVQSAEMKSCEGMKLKLREVQFQNATFRCELQKKEEQILELNQVKYWSEALKARYDLVLKEKEQALKNQKAVEVKCFSQGDEISSLKMKLNQKERDLEELKTGYNDVEDSSRIYREERDLYRLTLRDTAQNLEQARRQNDATVQGYKKTLDSKETTIQQQEEHMLQIERKYEESKEKLVSAKLRLKEQEEKNEELSKKISILEVQLQEKGETLNSHSLNQDDSLEDLQSVCETKDYDEAESIQEINFPKDREPKEVVGSIIRRFRVKDQQNTKGNLVEDNKFLKSKSMERLTQIIPEFKDLPLETQKGCSIDSRTMKQSLPYKLLYTIFQSTTGLDPSFPDSAMVQPCETPNVIRQLARRSMSLTDVANFLSFQPQDQDTSNNLQNEEGDEVTRGKFPLENTSDFQEDQLDTAQTIRGRTQLLLRRNGERRQRRKTEPSLFTPDFTEMEHL